MTEKIYLNKWKKINLKTIIIMYILKYELKNKYTIVYV